MLKILIIDSNLDYEAIYKRKLLKLRSDLTVCGTVSEGINKLTNYSYDLVMMSDIIKGAEGPKLFKTISRYHKGPITVLISGNNIQDIIANYKKSIKDFEKKSCMFINKGTNTKVFYTCVKQVLFPEEATKFVSARN